MKRAGSVVRGKGGRRRIDTSSRTKSVERPVRAVDLFIASLDALTWLEGSSTLSARIDSDEHCRLSQPVASSWRRSDREGTDKKRRTPSIAHLWPPKDAFSIGCRTGSNSE